MMASEREADRRRYGGGHSKTTFNSPVERGMDANRLRKTYSDGENWPTYARMFPTEQARSKSKVE